MSNQTVSLKKRAADTPVEVIMIDDHDTVPTAKRTCPIATPVESTTLTRPKNKVDDTPFVPNAIDIASDQFCRTKTTGSMSFDPEQAAKMIRSPNSEWSAIALWQGTLPVPLEKLDGKHIQDSVSQMFMDGLGCRVLYVGAVRTLPDASKSNGLPVPGTGGRSDFVLFVHKNDVSKFSVRRFKMGSDRPIWMCDASKKIYPPQMVHAFADHWSFFVDDEMSSSSDDEEE